MTNSTLPKSSDTSLTKEIFWIVVIGISVLILAATLLTMYRPAEKSVQELRNSILSLYNQENIDQ